MLDARRLSYSALLVACGALISQPVLADSTERVSVDGTGAQVSGSSYFPSISANGRFVVFRSNSATLVSGDTNGHSDFFVHDRQTGVIELVHVDSDGNQANRWSQYAAISADGRFVTFPSGATNLVGDDTNSVEDVFVHDRQTGVTERVSVDSAGNEGNGYSDSPDISANGRFVAFESNATNLIASDTNPYDVFVHDRQTGATERVSVDSAGTEANGVNFSPSISADGRFVAFTSGATNLVADDTNGVEDVFVHDRQTGMTKRVSVKSTGTEADDASGYSRISANGRFVAFESDATNLVDGHTNGERDVFVHDRLTGTIERVSVDSAGAEADDESRAYWTPTTISADDRFVTFFTNATNLVADDTNGTSDIFVRDRGLQPDGNNDFLADFGGAGLWVRYNNATWAKRHNASPQRMLATDLDGNGKADLVVDFGGAGLWVKRNNGPWTKIHNATTQDLAAGGFD